MSRVLSKSSFRPRMVVENRETRQKGVVVADLPKPMHCCDESEVPVVFEGSTVMFGTDYRNLKILGMDESEADLKKCGAGKGAECCKFLTVGPKGPSCERYGSLRTQLLFANMTAKRNPPEMFPRCQKF